MIMELKKKSMDSFENKMKAVSNEICLYSNRTRKMCCCHICLRLLKKVCINHEHLSSQTDNKTTIEGNDLLISLPLSAPLSQPTELQSRCKETPDNMFFQRNKACDPPPQRRLKIKRSKSLEDFNVINRSETESIINLNDIKFCQSSENKNHKHSSSESTGLSHQRLGTDLKESASNGSDSEETLPDPTVSSLSSEDDDNEDNKELPKLVENIQTKKHLVSSKSSQEDISSECLEIKQEVIEDDYSVPLFNYSQEDEVILIYDSDEQDIGNSPETNIQFEISKNVGQISSFDSINNLEDADTLPFSDLNDDTKEDQQHTESPWQNIQTEKSSAVLQPFKKQEVLIHSTSPKFMKNKCDNSTKGSFKTFHVMAKGIKQETKSDSDDSDDLFRDEIYDKATQLCMETEWEQVDVKLERDEKAAEKPYPLRRTQVHDLVEYKNADSIEVIQKPKIDNKMSSDDDDGDLKESLADDGDRNVRIKKALKTKHLNDVFNCPTQIDSHSDIAKLIKNTSTLEEESKIKSVTSLIKDTNKKSAKRRWKTSSSFYDDIDSDDDLFWCATQVDSNSNKEKLLNKEPFVVIDSDEDSESNNAYMMATQVDIKLKKSSPRGSKSSSTFELLGFSQAKASEKTFHNESWLPSISRLPEEDSDSDESMFSVATQVDDQHASNKYEDEQAYMTQTQVDLSFTSPKHKTGKTSKPQTSSLNVKKRKIKHRKDSHYKWLSDSYETADHSDSDDSVFSLATQIDNDDIDDDSLFIAAAKVDPEPLRSFKVPLSRKTYKVKPKGLSQNSKSFLKADKDYDSDDSVFSVATQVDAESPSSSKISKLHFKNFKSKNESTLKSVCISAEDYDSDSSMYSIATQIDTPIYKRKSDQKDEEEDNDTAYFVATQVDADIVESIKETRPMSPKESIFKVPPFPRKKLKTASLISKDSKNTATSHKQSTEVVMNTESVDHKPYSNFLFGIAEEEVKKEIVVISPEKKEDVGNSEETEKEFSKFLLDLSDVPASDQLKFKSKPIFQACPVEPLRLKTKKEMRESFKNQLIKDASNKISRPEEKLNQKKDSKIPPMSDTWLSKYKKPPIQKKTKSNEEVVISRNISEARNRLEERYFLSHLDNSRVGWNKASHIHYGSSSTITDVQLPDEDEIRKKGLPVIEGPRQRRPLPDNPIEHLPEEKQLDICEPSVNTLTNTIEQGKSPVKSPPIHPSTNLPKSPGVAVSTHFYRSSGLDTFKIPKLPNVKPKLPSNPVPQCTLSVQEENATEKCPSRSSTDLITPLLQMKQKITDGNITNKPIRRSANFGYQTKQTFSSCDSTSSTKKQNNYPASVTTRNTCSDSKNRCLQDRRIYSKNSRDLLLEHLLKWNPKWLTEQKNIKTIPPIVKMDQLLPLLNSYASLEDYQSIFRPLLLLEIWESISKDFSENCSKYRGWQVAFSNVQALNSYLMDYIVYGVISVQNYKSKKQMMEGDLLKMNLQVQNPQNNFTRTENIQQSLSYPVIGLVESIKFYDPQIHSEILKRFPQLAALSEVKSKFKIYRVIIKTHYRKLIHAFTGLMSLELISSLVPHLRQFQALMFLSSNLLCPHILNPGKGESAESGVNIPSTKKYNSSQMKAIAAAGYIVQKPLNQPSYCLIQGPPGTGKSHTIIGIIHKIKQINKGCKVLLCAPSNGAIDELTRRLIKERHIAQAESREPLKVVRIGNPDNIHEDVSSYSLTELIRSNTRAEIQNCASVYPELKRACANEKKIILKLKDPKLEAKKCHC